MVKNAARRLSERQQTFIVRDHPMKWEMVHFDVQLIGGIVLAHGRIAEMATGEGKTLVATLPVYLNALTGRGVHVVTVNDYLARRDGEWMGAVYKFLRPDGRLHSARSAAERAPRSNTIATSPTARTAEFGFDYLRDNGMATTRRSRSSAAITSPSSTKWIPS